MTGGCWGQMNGCEEKRRSEMHSLSPEWLRVDSRRTCTHWPLCCLHEAVQASPSHQGRSGHPSSEASCLGPHS